MFQFCIANQVVESRRWYADLARVALVLDGVFVGRFSFCADSASIVDLGLSIFKCFAIYVVVVAISA